MIDSSLSLKHVYKLCPFLNIYHRPNCFISILSFGLLLIILVMTESINISKSFIFDQIQSQNASSFNISEF